MCPVALSEKPLRVLIRRSGDQLAHRHRADTDSSIIKMCATDRRNLFRVSHGLTEGSFFQRGAKERVVVERIIGNGSRFMPF